MPLHRRRAEQRIALGRRVTELGQVVDGIQAGLLVGDVDVQVVLLAGLVHRDAFEDQVVLVVGRDGAWFEHRVFDPVLGHAAFDQLDLHVHPAGHFDGAAEGDFAIALAEVQVTHRQPGAVHIHREEDLRAAGQILDVAVTAMLTRWHGARAGQRGQVAGLALHLAHVRGRRHRCVGQGRHASRVGVDQLLLALVPVGQHLVVRQAADQTGVDQPGEVHPRDVPAAGEHAFEVPDGLLRQREVIGKKAAAVLLGEETVEAPLRLGLGADVEQVNHQQVAGLGTMHTDRAGEVVHGGEVNVAHVAGVVVVLDRAGGPVVGFEDEVVARLDPAGHRNVRVPAVVNLLVFGGGLVEVDLDQGIGHDKAPGTIEGDLAPRRRSTELVLNDARREEIR